MVTSRRQFPLLTSGPTPGSPGPHGSRSHMTCQYRCGNACAKPVPNTSDNQHFSTLVETVIARRSLLKTGGLGTGAMVLGGMVLGGLSPAPAAADTSASTKRGLGTVDFRPVRPNVRDNVTVASGFDHDVVVRWGDRVTADAPRFDAHRQTPESAAKQFGYNCDYVAMIDLSRSRAVLAVNNEYTDEALMFPTGVYDDATIKRIAMASHGMSIVEIERRGSAGSWRMSNPKRARLNRRVTALTTTFEIAGPAAGDPRLKTSADPRGRRVVGTLGNCAGGTTPWGTVLSGEENFNGYFDKSGELDPRYTASYERYGLDGEGRGWMDVDPRFDLTREPHEPYRFGYIIEVDPLDPDSTPRKHSMLGRLKHEGANLTIARNGHAVAYMGDDERGDYIYKFVSSGRFDPRESKAARRRNMALLTKGTLYVARFNGDGLDDEEYDGTGDWIALTSDTESYVDAMSVADVLLDTRLAADTVSPTKMDRPEDIEPNPVNGSIYCALTNNDERGTTFAPDEANPLTTSMVREELGAPLSPGSGNRNGYLLEMTESRGDHTATRFGWNLMLVCGDPEAPETYFAGFPKERVSPISCPDNVAFDKVGNLWIATDGNALGSNDGLFRVPVEGPRRGHVEQLLTVPLAAEACGPLISADQRSVFVAVQHPGEVDGATFENQASTWPHTDDFPRPSVIVAYQD